MQFSGKSRSWRCSCRCRRAICCPSADTNDGWITSELKLCVFYPSLCLHRIRHLSLQKVRSKVQKSLAPPARLPGLCRLHLHRFLLLPPFFLFLLQRLRLPLPSLPVPLFLLRAPSHLLRSRGPAGRGGRGSKGEQNPPQASAQPQLATRALGRPPEGVGLQFGATAAGSVRQQRVHGVKPTGVRGKKSQPLPVKGRRMKDGEEGESERGSCSVSPPLSAHPPPPLVQSKLTAMKKTKRALERGHCWAG